MAGDSQEAEKLKGGEHRVEASFLFSQKRRNRRVWMRQPSGLFLWLGLIQDSLCPVGNRASLCL